VLDTVSPLRIDSFYVASMDPSLFGVTGEITASLTSELDMLPRETLGIRGTSSAGGIGVIPAYKDIASGRYAYTLLISCEQMNRVVGKDDIPESVGRAGIVGRADIVDADRKNAVQQLLRGVIDPTEQVYGLSMILIGDMYEKALLRYLGISKRTFLELIPRITAAMYERASHYPYAHFHGNAKTSGDYEASPWVSPHYRRDDVVPPSTAACAMVLSSKPPASPVNGRIVRLRGIGQGVTHPALTRRFGPVTSSPSLRRAIYELARRASIPLSAMREVDIGYPHDAFPSISRMILKEAGFTHDESIAGLLDGRFNPCGGLVKCGHPVGCSGELQLVRAFQQMTYDRSAIPDAIQRRPADRAFTVSVGAALTNIIATYLDAYDKGSEPEPGPVTGKGLDENEFKEFLDLAGGYDRYERAMDRIPADSGIVLTSTRSELGWINLVQTRNVKIMALGEEELEIGAVVEHRTRTDGLNEIARVVSEQVDDDFQRALGIIP
jgi:acetyl-CoA C-acetyltransferase